MSPQALSAFFVAFVLFGVTVATLFQRLKREERFSARVLSVHRDLGIDVVVETGPHEKTGGLPVMRLVGALGELITSSGLLSGKTLEALQQQLKVAGFRGRGALGMLVGAKLLLLVMLPALTWMMLRQTGWQPPLATYWPVGAAIIGLLAPDFIVNHLRRRYIKALEKGLPDALDLLVICSEAGLGLEPGLERVGYEVRQVHRAVSDEFLQVTQELRLNSDRRAALMNMGTRTGVENLRRLGGTLVQTLQYGTPLSQALRVLAAEMRTESLTAFETRAGRLPVLMTLPMILFILPCVFMVVGGPAMVKVFQTMR